MSLKLLLKIHWISSAPCLLGMLLFSVSGITLNHATQIEAAPTTIARTLTLPPATLDTLLPLARARDGGTGGLPAELAGWARQALRIDLGGADAEWSADEIYVPLPRPGGDAWLRIGLPHGEVEYEVTDRGWVSWLNDLHKGRHTGVAWSWFIDLLAFTCLVFALSGLWLLKLHAAQRHSTWPLVGAGVLMPVLIALLFIH